MFMFFAKKNTRKILQINTVLILAFLLAIEFSLGFTADNKANQLRALRTKDATYQPVVLPSEILKRRDLQKIVTDSAGSPLVPIAGIPSVPTLLCKEGDGWVDYRSDKFGLNNPAGVIEEENSSVILVGDSFVHGYCVQTGNTLIDQIRTRYPDAKNLGFGGSGPLLQIARLKEFGGEDLSNTNVFWLFFVNDLADLDLESKNPTLMDYLKPGFSQNLASRIDAVKRSLTAVSAFAAKEVSDQELADRLLLRALRYRLGLVRKIPGRLDPSLELRLEPLLTQILKAARQHVHSRGGCLRFVFLAPRRHNTFEGKPLDEERRNPALRAAQTAGLPIIDLRPRFSDHQNPASLFPEGFGHYNTAGYRLVADVILKILEKSNSSTVWKCL